MLVSAISYLNRNSNIGVESSSSKHQSSKSNITENFGNHKNKVNHEDANFVKKFVNSVSSFFKKDKTEANNARCLSIIG